MSSFNLTVEGNTEVKLKLDNIAKAVKDFRPAFINMEPDIVLQFKNNFDSAGATLGKGWPPRKMSYPWPILQKTKRMKNNWDKSIQRLSMKVINSTPYAGFHNFGTIHLPVRAIVGVNPTILQRIVDAIQRHIRKSL